MQKRDLDLIFFFGLILAFPSLGVVEKFAGLPGVVGYGSVILVAALLYRRYANPLHTRMARLSPQAITAGIGLAILAALIAIIVLFPIADSGVIGGGSDADEALNVAVAELLAGRYPYHVRTYQNNPISPMPGAVLLAIPFVLLGESVWQSVFWFAVCCAVIGARAKDRGVALALLWGALILCPVLIYYMVNGQDYIANGIYLALCGLWLVEAARAGRRDAILAACALGIGLSSRANFLLIAPLIFGAIAGSRGWRSALVYALITGATFALVTLPFYLTDPAGFSPLHTANKLRRFESILPGAALIVIAAAGALSLLLGMRLALRRDQSVSGWLWGSVLVVALPVIAGVILESMLLRRITFGYAFYGAMYVPFGLLWAMTAPLSARSAP